MVSVEEWAKIGRRQGKNLLFLFAAGSAGRASAGRRDAEKGIQFSKGRKNTCLFLMPGHAGECQHQRAAIWQSAGRASAAAQWLEVMKDTSTSRTAKHERLIIICGSQTNPK